MVDDKDNEKNYDRNNDRNSNNKNHSDELYTITLFDQSETVELIPERLNTSEKIIAYEKQNKLDNKTQEAAVSLTKVQKKLEFYSRKGLPPVLTASALIAKQAYYKPPVMVNANKKSFLEQAREYADKTNKSTEHIPFMCYWPSYEYMSEAQLNWYLYMRGCLRKEIYINTDLSYLFVYIYELINQIGVESPDDGLDKIINIWINYRNSYDKLDSYLTDWIGDYISFYKCDADSVFKLLKKEGLFLLMPADMLADYYFKNNVMMPIELITRFCDYKFYESEFIKGENGNLFTDYLSSLINDIRCRMNQVKDGSFEKRDILITNTRQHKKLPFQRAIFNNPDNVCIDSYLPYEQHKPFRYFITAVIKEFENQLRILTKYRGRLRPDRLPDEILDICKQYARNAFNGSQPEQKVEITIDREKLLALIHDSDEVRKRLIEGNYDYDGEFKPGYTSGNIDPPGYENITNIESEKNNESTKHIETVKHIETEKYIETEKHIETKKHIETEKHFETVINIKPEKHIEYVNNTNPPNSNIIISDITWVNDIAPVNDITSISDNTSINDITPIYDITPVKIENDNSFKSNLEQLQQRIVDFLLSKGGSSTTDEINAAFPGVFVGIEIDKINDIALEAIGDLLITFENERWNIIEDYINDL